MMSKMLKFEFDENKSLINSEKHGIDFIEAQKLFQNKTSKIYPAKNINEKRFLISGFINEKCWTMIFTLREDIIRIISIRRCREKEKRRIDDNS